MRPTLDLATSRNLNQRQADILQLVRRGLRNHEIATLLGLSERTIKGYCSQLFLIFDVTNRTELAFTIAETAGDVRSELSTHEHEASDGMEPLDVAKK